MSAGAALIQSARLLPVYGLLAASCVGGLAERYEAGNRALSTGDGPMYSVIIAPVLQEALNGCIPAGTAGASRVLMILADIEASGMARNVVVEPDSPGSHCVKERLGQSRFRAPPLQPGQSSFPIGLRIEQGYGSGTKPLGNGFGQ